MRHRMFLPAAALALLALPAPRAVWPADWPQFMRTAEHTADAAEESLRLPLGLATCVRLDHAVTTSPAVAGGKVYVVDQMGTAYASIRQRTGSCGSRLPTGSRPGAGTRRRPA